MQMEIKELFSVYHPDCLIVREHTHDFFEMVYCLEGRGSVQIRNQKTKFSTGNYYITHPGTPHTEKNDDSSRIIYFYFVAPTEMVIEGSYTDYNGSILSAVKKLREEMAQNLLSKEKMLQALLMQILIEAQRVSIYSDHEISLHAILQYIDDNIEQNIDFPGLACRNHYSYNRFRHIFKDFTGSSPHQYVINRRIEKAKFLLRLSPGTSIAEIALRCGFSTASQFSNIFRIKTGVTPTMYIHSKD